MYYLSLYKVSIKNSQVPHQVKLLNIKTSYVIIIQKKYLHYKDSEYYNIYVA